MQQISSNRCFNGTQYVYEHDSVCCQTTMRFAVYLPDQAKLQPCPTLYWLSGLTCTEQNFITKAGAQRLASELGLIIIAPDTSPRGDTPDEPERYDLGHGASFYVDATQDPWAKNYQMHTYIANELPALLPKHLPIDTKRQGIFGHSMGGHGALTLHLRYPEQFKSVSAFAPIVAPTTNDWGRQQLTTYLGIDKTQWQQYDACLLVKQKSSRAEILIDQGLNDEFLKLLQPERFVEACQETHQAIELRQHDGFDHSYYMISTFMEDHLRHHWQQLSQITN